MKGHSVCTQRRSEAQLQGLCEVQRESSLNSKVHRVVAAVKVTRRASNVTCFEKWVTISAWDWQRGLLSSVALMGSVKTAEAAAHTTGCFQAVSYKKRCASGAMNTHLTMSTSALVSQGTAWRAPALFCKALCTFQGEGSLTSGVLARKPAGVRRMRRYR